jgi:hypothetical protein
MSIPPSPRRSRIAHFKAPFIISVAGSAALGLGCGGKTDAEAILTTNPPPQVGTVDGVSTCDGDPPSSNANSCTGPIWSCVDGKWEATTFSCNPPYAQSTVCPESPAEIGTSCGGYLGGLSCDYADGCNGTSPLRRCSESTALWESILPPSCNPPPPDDPRCEATLPVPGSDCTFWEFTCSYPGGCQEPATAVCRAGQWFVTYSSGPACNPPAVIPVCPERQLVNGEDCAYEGQACSNEACEPGAESHAGYVCSANHWQDATVTCPVPTNNAPDAGASDGGAPDGGG